MRRSSFLVCLAAILGLASASCKAEHPYSGYFSYAPRPLSASEVELYCAMRFFFQNADGTSGESVIDIAKFEETGRIEYNRVTATRCAYMQDSKTEFCSSQFNSADNSYVSPFWSYLVRLSHDNYESIVFNDGSDYAAFMASPGRRFEQGRYPSAVYFYTYRCPFHSDSLLKPYRKDKNSLTSEETYGVMSADFGKDKKVNDLAAKAAKILRPVY